MTVPYVTLQKTDGNTGVTPPSVAGVVAIIAPSSSGTANLASMHTKPNLVQAEFGNGILPEFAAKHMLDSGKAVICIRGTAATAGAYGSVTEAGEGTGEVTAGATEPVDDFDVVIAFVAGGTRGTAGITYKYSLDGGVSYSAVQALGTAVSIELPGTGVSVALAAGTYLAGQTATFSTTRPKMTNANVVTALEALRVANLPWEAVYVAGIDAAAAEVTTLDDWLSGLEAVGKFRMGFLHTRGPNSGETEAQYRTAMETAFSGSASIRQVLGSGRGDVASPIRGITQSRPSTLAVVSRCMKIDIGRDPAAIADGPVSGFGLTDAKGNPKHHNEDFYPGLDALRLATLRTVPGREGTFITNAPALSSTGSDYVYVQHIRIANAMCETAFSLFMSRLSLGVRRDQATGFIDESDAQDIETFVNQGLRNTARGRTSAYKFTLSRNDDISSNQGAILTGTLDVSALAYVKGIEVKFRFVKTITSSAA